MKFFHLWLFVLALGFSVGSQAQPTLSPSSREVSASWSQYLVLVDTDAEWTAVSEAPWVSILPSNGRGQIRATVTVLQNTSGTPRQTAFTVAGVTHTIAQRASSSPRTELLGWGMSDAGQLGSPHHFYHTRPSSHISGVSSAAAGHFYSLCVKTDGTLWAMGDNSYGQLGDGTTITRTDPVMVATGVASVVARGSHSLFVKTDGTLWAMGENSSGQLGDGTTIVRASPVMVAAGVASVATGYSHSLFVKTDGTLWAMGATSSGQFGNGSVNSDSVTIPVQVASGVATAAAGSGSSFFVKTDGTLWGMGYNVDGELGDGTVTQRSIPVLIETGVASVTAGFAYTFFVKTSGTLWGMGYNADGQLGDGTTVNPRRLPVQIATDVVSVAASGYHSQFVKVDGTLWAMGLNFDGRLGDGSTTLRRLPVQVATGVLSVTLGEDHSLFVKTDRTLWAVGSNSVGQHGNQTADRASRPFSVATDVGSVAAGDSHSLLVKTDGTLWGIGDNSNGQLGDGSTTMRTVPVFVSASVDAVAAGNSHSLFVKTDKTLWAMGSGVSGQLGVAANQSLVPLQVAQDVVSVTARGSHSFFVKTDGTMWAMGDNSTGQLGDGTLTSRTEPIQVATGVKSVSAGYGHSLYVKTDGTLWAMGTEIYGQNGTSPSSSPMLVTAGVVSVAAGFRHSLFVKTDGTLWAMGENLFGKLGDGGNSGHDLPVQVATGVVSVAAGRFHSLFLKSDGTVWTMGTNQNGQLGDLTLLASSSTPRQVLANIVSIAAGGNHSFAVGAVPLEPPVITWPDPAPVSVGTALSGIQLNATANVPGSFTYAPPVGTVLGPGISTLSATFTPADTVNYRVVTAQRSLTVTKLTPAVAWEPAASITYGTPLTSTLLNAAAGDVLGIFTYTPALGTVLNAGPHILSVTFSPTNSTDFQSVTIQRTLTVNRATLVVKPDDKTRSYGSSNPVFTLSYSGFVNGDSAAVLTALPTVVTAANVQSNAGLYAIAANFAAAANYDFTYVMGVLTVTKATLTVTADDKTRAYGAADPVFTVSYTGFMNGESASVLTVQPAVSSTATVLSNVGTYAITASGGSATNYILSYVAGVLTVTKATLTITADDKTRTYGATNPTFTVSYAGFVNGESPSVLTALPTAGTAATVLSNVGTYAVTPSGGSAANYSFVYLPGVLAVTKAPLTVTADDKTRTYGAANPAFTVSFAGFVNGESASALLTPPTATTEATVLSNVGTYAITAGGGIATNYSFVYVSGVLTVIKAPLIVTALDQTRLYGGTNPAFPVTYAGFVNGESAAVFTSAVTAATAANVLSPVGGYAIVPSGGVAANYSFTYIDGSLSIRPAPLVVTAENKVRMFGLPNPAFTLTYAGFVNGENVAALAVAVGVGTPATLASVVGHYAINPSGGTASNYVLSYVPGVLTITTAAEATQTTGGVGYMGGRSLRINNTLTYSGALTVLKWQVLLPTGQGWSYDSGLGAEGQVRPAIGATEILEWEWTTIPASPITFSYVLRIPAGATTTQVITAIASMRQAGIDSQVFALPESLTVSPARPHHDADTDQNLQISLFELTRVIELYNTRSGATRTGAYSIAPGWSEDAFVADPSRGPVAATLAFTHSCDTSRDGRISLLELTRVIELYNTRLGTTRNGAYHVQTGTEDGFAVGP